MLVSTGHVSEVAEVERPRTAKLPSPGALSKKKSRVFRTHPSRHASLAVSSSPL